MPVPVGEVSDGYHTFNELYEHRNLLFCAFLSALTNEGRRDTWKSHTHNSGDSYDGWFLAGVELCGHQVTYHLPDEMWELCYVANEYAVAPPWDGHSSADVIERIRLWLR
jgi:hypothetical protein